MVALAHLACVSGTGDAGKIVSKVVMPAGSGAGHPNGKNDHAGMLPEVNPESKTGIMKAFHSAGRRMQSDLPVARRSSRDQAGPSWTESHY